MTVKKKKEAAKKTETKQTETAKPKNSCVVELLRIADEVDDVAYPAGTPKLILESRGKLSAHIRKYANGLDSRMAKVASKMKNRVKRAANLRDQIAAAQKKLADLEK